MKQIKITIVTILIIFTVGIIFTQIQTKNPKPSDMNVTEDGAEYKVPPQPVRQVRKLEPAKIEGYEVQYLVKDVEDMDSKFILLTFKGSGFILSSLAPRVIINRELILDNSHINEKGTELYIIIPRDILDTKIKQMKFEEIIIENPAGPSDKNFGGLHVKMKPQDLLEVDPDVNRVILEYKNNFYTRRNIEEKK